MWSIKRGNASGVRQELAECPFEPLFDPIPDVGLKSLASGLTTGFAFNPIEAKWSVAFPLFGMAVAIEEHHFPRALAPRFHAPRRKVFKRTELELR
jgi:hypothetical protein